MSRVGSAAEPELRVLASPGGVGADGNPYIDLLYRGVAEAGVRVTAFSRRELLEGHTIVHVHWPAALVRWEHPVTAMADALKVLTGLLVARRRGSRLVWTGHDLEPHEIRRPRLFKAYFAVFSRMVDLWISLTPSGAEQLQERYPVLRRRPHRVIPHGSYRGVYGPEQERTAARHRLGIPSEPAPAYLLLGQIRRYKRALELVTAFTAAASSDARLLVAGEVRGDAELADELRAAASGAADVTLRLGRIPAAEIAAWHGAADVVVLPYDARSALNSGALLLALSLDRPVVAPDSPINREIRDAVGATWVHLSDGDVAEALIAAAAAARTERSGRPDLDAFAWPPIVAATVEAYRAAAGIRRPSGPLRA